MRILIKFPTRQRPIIFLNTLEEYYNKLSGKHDVRFIITMDLDDQLMNKKAIRDILDTKANLKYYYGTSKTKIQAINANIDDDFEILILVSDDMLPTDSYDDIIAQHMLKHFPNFDGVLHFNDGRKGKRLNTLPIMGVNIYKHFGYIYHPSYESLYCDNEFQDVTERMNKAVYIDQVIIKHAWTEIYGGKKDELYRRNDEPVMRDKANYVRRKALGFPNP